MPSNSSLNLVPLDFDELKASFKAFLKAQPIFSDYNFEGSNLSVLLDLLAYNTVQLGVYANFLASEQFLDSAQLKDSIISHAKELNYLPRSFRSAVAKVNVRIIPDTIVENILIAKGTSFSTRVGSNSFSFTVPENTVISNREGANTVYANNLLIYEGSYVVDQYVLDYSLPVQRFVITNPTVDTSSIAVTITEDSGSKTSNYFPVDSTYGLNGQSNVYFLQAAEGEKYEILFGDGVIGHRPKNGATIVIEYRATSGQLPNGAQAFFSDGPIDGQSDISVATVNGANGGSVSESLDSIRVNAPRFFQTQERAVTTSDYETLLLQNFSDLQAVSVYGGEEVTPPQFGLVFISADVKSGDVLTTSEKENLIQFLKVRAPVSISPIFVDPEFTFIDVIANVNYSFTKTSLSPNDVKTLVVSAIQEYNNNNLKIFKAKIRYSRLLELIDNSHASIISSSLRLRLSKRVEIPGNTKQNIIINFGQSFDNSFAKLDPVHPIDFDKIISSSRFIYNGSGAELEDDGNGIIRIVTVDGTDFKTLANIGTINYSTGEIIINTFTVDFIENELLKIYAEDKVNDVIAGKNVILEIADDDITVSITPVKDLS